MDKGCQPQINQEEIYESEQSCDMQEEENNNLNNNFQSQSSNNSRESNSMIDQSSLESENNNQKVKKQESISNNEESEEEEFKGEIQQNKKKKIKKTLKKQQNSNNKKKQQNSNEKKNNNKKKKDKNQNKQFMQKHNLEQMKSFFEFLNDKEIVSDNKFNENYITFSSLRKALNSFQMTNIDDKVVMCLINMLNDEIYSEEPDEQKLQKTLNIDQFQEIYKQCDNFKIEK